MNVSNKKMTKKFIDDHLLTTIYTLQANWKITENIIAYSVEPSDESIIEEEIALAKYMFMLRQARKRKINARSFSE